MSEVIRRVVIEERADGTFRSEESFTELDGYQRCVERKGWPVVMHMQDLQKRVMDSQRGSVPR